MGVVRTGSGKVARVDVEVKFAFRAIMHGISKLDKNGASFGAIAEMSKFSASFAMLAAIVTAMGARTFDLYSRAFFDDGLGQIITGLGHGGNLLEAWVQGDNLPEF